MKIAPANFPQQIASPIATQARPAEQPVGDTYQSGEDCPYNPRSMSLGERVATTAGLGSLGAVAGVVGGLLTMSSASQLSALPYFALAGGAAGCALAAVAIIGES